MKLSKRVLKETLHAFRSLMTSDIRLLLGLTIFIVFLVLAFVVSKFVPFNPKRWGSVPRDIPPSLAYPLGTTSMGRDLFWLLTLALQNSIIIGIVVASVSTLVGVTLGLLAGYKGGYLDRILTTLTDTFIAVPSMPILIMMASLFLGRIHILMLSAVLCLFNWPWPAKQARSMILSLRERTFIETAVFSGTGTAGIILSEVMPLIAPWILANFTNTVLVAIATEAGLATIGVSSLEEATLGTMVYWALQYQALFRGHWWWIAVPAGTIVILFVSLFLISTAVSDIFSLGGSAR